jgi:hypothetical protein
LALNTEQEEERRRRGKKDKKRKMIEYDVFLDRSG